MMRWGTGMEGRRIADLGDGTYRNPVLAGDFPDPTVLRDGPDYYLTTSSFDASPGLLIHHSRDLVNWAPLTFALPRPLTTVFAVDLVKHGGRYFIYIPFIPSPWAPEFGSAARIFVIWADRMEGPWSEPVDLGITGAIDPGHVAGEDRKRYLFLNGVRRVRLTDDGLASSTDEAWWSRGHATAVEGPDGGWWLVYHGYENGFRSLGPVESRARTAGCCCSSTARSTSAWAGTERR